nr:MAG TPA: hypothetical protein [Caudoviricetes sp.]
MNKEEFRMSEEDKQFIKDMVMKLKDYSLDDLEVIKTIISKETENQEDGEALKHCATQIIDIDIRAKKELAYKL